MRWGWCDFNKSWISDLLYRAEAAARRDAAVAAPRMALEAREREMRQTDGDVKGQELEERRKRLQMQLEEVATELAAKRAEHVALDEKRAETMAGHRGKMEAVERELQVIHLSLFLSLSLYIYIYRERDRDI